MHQLIQRRRQTPEYQGGFLLDGGVHFIAGLRYLLNGIGQDIKSLAAFTALAQLKLAPVDTVHAILASDCGRSGTFSVSFGAAFKSGFEIDVVTTKGRVTVTPTSVTTECLDEAGKQEGGEGGISILCWSRKRGGSVRYKHTVRSGGCKG